VGNRAVEFFVVSPGWTEGDTGKRQHPNLIFLRTRKKEGGKKGKRDRIKSTAKTTKKTNPGRVGRFTWEDRRVPKDETATKIPASERHSPPPTPDGRKRPINLGQPLIQYRSGSRRKPIIPRGGGVPVRNIPNHHGGVPARSP